MVSASCSGGPVSNPKVILYESAKKPIRVRRVCLRDVDADGDPGEDAPVMEPDSGSAIRPRISFVTIAVWVTFMGIIVFLTDAFKTIWAASARVARQTGAKVLRDRLTIAENVVFWDCLQDRGSCE